MNIQDESGFSSGVGMEVPRTSYFEIGLNLAAKLPEHTSAVAEPKVDRILRGMADYIHDRMDWSDGTLKRGLTVEEIYAGLVTALDVAR